MARTAADVMMVVDLQPIDFVKAAEACGVTAYGVEDPAECRATLARALAEPAPTLVEAVVDPDELPLPPHITPDQARRFTRSDP